MTDVPAGLRAALADRYAIERELGRGGMATVFLARDLRHNRMVALKVLHGDLASALGPERFVREIEIVGRLTHPHILPLYDSGETAGFLYYVMPFVEGESLRDRLDRERQLPVEDAVQLAREVADALSFAHGHDVVHRDIKPENILLQAGHAVVSDFGIARAVTAAAGSRLTETGVVVGTPAYMSPEQAAGEARLDGRSDVYSLGCLLYEMLAGEPPFTGPTAQAVIARRLTEAPPDLRLVRETVTAELERVLGKALARFPADRFPTAERFARALAEVSGVQAAAPAARRPPRLRASRLRLRQGALAALLLAAAGLATALWLRTRRSTVAVSHTAVAVLPFAMRGSQTLAYLGEGMVNLLSTSLDGAGALRSVDPRAVLSVVKRQGGGVLDPELARAVAGRLGAGLYVVGDIVEAGGRLRFDAALYDPARGEVALAKATVEGNEAGIFQSVDDLARQLLAGQAAGRGARATGLAAVTTQSLPALKAYLKGERAFRAGDFGAATVGFREAVAADTLFALAYYRLAVAGSWQGGQKALVGTALDHARRHADRLTEHDRLLVDAFWEEQLGTADEAERRYRAIVGAYPDDIEAWFNLGDVLIHTGPMRARPQSDAREPFERVLSFEPDLFEPLDHLAWVAAIEGRYAEQDSLVSRVLDLYPENEGALAQRAVLAYSRRDQAAEQRVAANLRRADDLAVIYAAVVVIARSPDFRDGAAIAPLLTEPSHVPEVRALGHIILAHLALARGRWDAAKEELATAATLDPVSALEYRALLTDAAFLDVPERELHTLQAELGRWNAGTARPRANSGTFVAPHNGIHPLLRPYLLGLVSARLHQGDVAARNAAELERHAGTNEPGALARALAASIRARVARGGGSPGDAVRALDQARIDVYGVLSHVSPIYSQGRERYLRAELLRGLGRDAEALRWYDSAWRQSMYDYVYLGPSLLRQAEIYERLGQRQEAMDRYSRLVELWKDCDGQFRPMAAEARAALERLGPAPAR